MDHRIALAAQRGAAVRDVAVDTRARKDAWVVAHHLAEVRAGAATIAGGGRVAYVAERGSRTADALLSHGLPMHDTAPDRTPLVDAETAWRTAQVTHWGTDWFHGFGTSEEPGPRLVTVLGHVARPGVLATVAGVRVRDLVAAAAPLHHEGGVAVGGVDGVLLDATTARSLRWSDADLAPHGASIGSGLVELLDPRVCPLEDLVLRLRNADPGRSGRWWSHQPTLADEVAALVAAPAHRRLTGPHASYVASALRIHHDHVLHHAVRECPLRPAGARLDEPTVAA